MRWGLRAKLLFSAGCLIFLTLGTSTGVHMYTLRRDYLEAVTWRSEALAQTMINDLTKMLGYSSNVQGLLEAKSIQCIELYELNKDKNVSHVAIMNADGVIAAHNDQALWNTSINSPELHAALKSQELATILENAAYHTLIPVFGQQNAFVGMIDIGFPKHVVDKKIRQLLFNAAGLLSLFGVITFVTISLIIQMFAIKPLGSLMAVMKEVERGNLDVEATGFIARDEIGLLAKRLNQMVRQLRMIVGQVQRSGIQVTSSSTELSATAKQQEAIINHQMDSMNNMVESVRENSDVSIQLADTMGLVASMLEGTAEFATSSQTNLSHMQDEMSQMEEASTSISNKLKAINDKADNISTVVTTITGVADQTNLLSLNAAIEAEKAGEYGRGFTVVAREIRRLADQTAVATLDIEQMVKEMQSAMVAGVMEMDKFIKEVRHSAEDVGEVSMQLTQIIEQVQVLSPSFEEVNIAMGQQSEHAQNITRGMTELSEEMQQTRESLHETYSAIEQLNDTARNLRDEVSQFKVR